MDLRADQNRVGPTDEEKEVEKMLIDLLFREEVMWRQRSCVQWLAKGDSNTKFFS